MRLEHLDQEAMKRKILGVISRHLDPQKYRVFVFGSRVRGGGDERSDIDVGIEGAEPVPWGDLAHIHEDMENLDTLYKVDVVDFADVSPQFKEVAKQHIEIIN